MPRMFVYHELHGVGHPTKIDYPAETLTVDFFTARQVVVPIDSVTQPTDRCTDEPRDYLDRFILHEKYGLGRVFDVDAKRMLVVDSSGMALGAALTGSSKCLHRPHGQLAPTSSLNKS